MDDRELLQEYIGHRSERAFAELVARHLPLVLGTALRLVREPQAAADVAQTVFIQLARKAWTIRNGQVLSGWLYRVTHHTALKALRTEQRRRERETTTMKLAETQSSPEPDWEHLAPLVDEAMHLLKRGEQDALLLRFFEDKSYGEVGRILGVDEKTAGQRVNRALEKMRRHFSRKGVTTTATLLGAALTAHAAAPVPMAMAANISGASLAGAGGSGALSGFLIKTYFMTITTKSVLLAAIVIATATTSYQIGVSHARHEIDSTSQTVSPEVQSGKQATRNKLSLVAETPADHAAELAAILRLNGRGMAEITRTMGQFLSKLKPEEIPGLFDLLKTTPRTSTSSLIEAMLISAWAEHDPAAALAWARHLPKTESAEGDADFQTAMQTWAATDPVAAANYALTMSDDPNFLAIVDSIVQNWSAADPKAAWDWVKTLPVGSAQQNAERTVITNLAKVSPDFALEAAVAMPDDASGIRIKILNNVMTEWSVQDPAQAATRVDDVPSGPARKSAYGIVASAWLKKDPSAAAAWINALPAGNPRDNAMKMLVSVESGVDPSAAFQSALTMQNVDLRLSTLTSLTQKWAKSDPASAAAAIGSANLTDDERNSLNTVIANANPASAQTNLPGP